MKSRKSYCTTPGVGGGGVVSKMLSFHVKVFYVMGEALSGELSCPCDRSCYQSYDPLSGLTILSTDVLVTTSPTLLKEF